MRTTIVTRQMEGGVPKDLQEIFETKLAKYDKFFRDDASATVKLSRVRGRERVEITISSAGVLYRGEETDETFRNAFDSATGAIERQIRKNKTRLEKRLREGAIADLYTPEPEKEDEEAIIRRKTFDLHPMTPDEPARSRFLRLHRRVERRDERGVPPQGRGLWSAVPREVTGEPPAA